MSALLDLHNQLTAALPLAGSRQLGNGQTARELVVESAFAAAMRPVLDELYRYPLQGGLTAVPEVAREELTAWLLAQYRDPESTAVLSFTLRQHFERGFNAGGALALEALGLPGSFALTDEAVLAGMAETTVSFADPDGEISLTRTTANDLGRWIVNGRAEGLEPSALAAVLASAITARTLGRSSNIAATETVRWSRRGLGVTYDRNGIEWMIYRTNAGGSETGPCPICEPFNGRRLRASNGTVWYDLLPQHGGCVCYYEPDTSGWTEPEEVWAG